MAADEQNGLARRVNRLGPVSPADGSSIRWEVAGTSLWLKRTGVEWWWAVTRDGDSRDRLERVDGADAGSSDLTWTRAVLPGGEGAVRLSLAPPDRPVVARPDAALVLYPGSSEVLYTEVPLWLQLHVDGRHQVLDEPVRVLSKTWFGSLPETGAVCYAAHTRASTDAAGLDAHLDRALCPVQIENQSDAPFSFERLCLTAPSMPMYAGDRHWWTAPCQMVWRGDDLPEKITVGHQPPRVDNASTRIAEPRSKAEGGLWSKSFETLKSFRGRP